MRIRVRVGNQDGEAFMDSGCTFNAVSSAFAKKCMLSVEEFDNDLTCAIGGGKSIKIKRRVARCSFDLLELGKWDTQVFVMDPIPLGCDAIFGLGFLRAINPEIDWQTGKVTPGQSAGTNGRAFLQQEIMHRNVMMQFINGRETATGTTKVICPSEYEAELAKVDKNCDDTFFFIIQARQEPTGKAQRYQDQGWEKLQNNPAYSVLRKYKDSVFREKLSVKDVAQDHEIEHTIELTDDIPVVVKQFRLSPDQRAAVEAWTSEMEEAGLIRPSTSPYSSPIFCVKKPVGWRIVHDYRLLNAKTKIPKEPIPRKDDIIDAMQGSYWFSCMDLLSGYYQLMLKEEHRAYSAFSTPKGHYEYLVTAQGLAGAPATFNRFVQKIFRKLQDVSRAFFDDIYVFTRSSSVEEHVTALDRVLRRCEETGLSIKLSKCVFVSCEIPVLGDFIGREGARMDPDKVAIITSWPTPRTRTELKSFLGTIGYCARFCKDYGKLVAPLHRVTQGKKKREAIVFTEDELACFEGLKVAMSNTPTLALPDFSKRFGVRMDACDYAIGGVLFQLDDAGEEHPIAYAGRKMSRAEMNYPVREKELLAIIYALKTWRTYLLDQPFTVETDHQTLKDLLTQRTCTQRLARWLNLISEYRPEFKWIPGHTNNVADGISRRSDFVPADQPASSVTLPVLLRSILETTEAEDDDAQEPSGSVSFNDYDQAMMVFQLLSARDITALCIASYPTDRHFAPVWEFFLQGGQDERKAKEYARYKMEQGLLWYSAEGDEQLRLCVPSCSELKRKILFSEHDDPSRGHPGTFKTICFVKRKYYWRNMNSDIKNYIRTCEKCQRNKHRQTRAPGLLNVLPVPEARWQHITMDFILSLPMSDSNNAIWVIVDRLTKRAHFIPVSMGDNESSARACASIFRKEYQRLHGIPETIVSDRDTRFTSIFWQEFMKLQGSLHKMSSAFRPNTDGQTERTNRFIEDYLRNYVHATQENWAELVYSAEIAYNSRVHESIKMSPFEADIGYIPRAVPDHVFDRIVGSKSKQEIWQFGKRQQETLELLKSTLEEAQNRMKRYYDRNRPIQTFAVGDKVLLSAKNLNIEHLGISASGTTKFGPLWIGPYPVLAKTSIDTYKLQLPVGLHLHPEFHTSLLKPYQFDADGERLNLPNEGMVGAGGAKNSWLIEDVIKHKREKDTVYYLVKWLGFPAEHNTWEPLENISRAAGGLIDIYLSKHGLDKSIWNPVIRRSKRRLKIPNTS